MLPALLDLAKLYICDQTMLWYYDRDSSLYVSDCAIWAKVKKSEIRLWDIVVDDPDEDPDDICVDDKKQYLVWCRHPQTGHFTYSDYFVENIIEQSVVWLNHKQHREELIQNVTTVDVGKNNTVIYTYCTIYEMKFYIYFSRLDENDEDICFIGLSQNQLDEILTRIRSMFKLEGHYYNLAKIDGEEYDEIYKVVPSLCKDLVILPNVLWCYDF